MYLDWVLPILCILLICILIYGIYYMTKPLSESFITAVPPQEYSIPEIRGVGGRYVRIRPSITNGDGYLTISQIQLIDANDNNAAIGARVSATSFGGSPVDQKYGSEVLYGSVYELEPGSSSISSCVIDGEVLPRWSLVNVFETGIQNKSPQCPSCNDDQYLEIDLSANVIIKTIIYSGRADPETRTIETLDGTLDVIDQVSRLKEMRLEIYDAQRNLTFSTVFSEDPTTHMATIHIDSPLYTLNAGAGIPISNYINIPNVESYAAVVKPFQRLYGQPLYTANKDLINAVNTLYTPLNTQGDYTTLPFTFDISGSPTIFSSIVSESPINFYNEIYMAAGCPNNTAAIATADAAVLAAQTAYNNVPSNPLMDFARKALSDAKVAAEANAAKVRRSCMANPSAGSSSGSSNVIPALVPTIPVQIFGTISNNAKDEMNASMELCKRMFVGVPEIVENYIRLNYSVYLGEVNAFLKNPSSNMWCMPDLIQIFSNGQYKTAVSPTNVTWNASHCSIAVTPDLLTLFPYGTRNFMVDWIHNRALRYIHYRNSLLDDIVDQEAAITIAQLALDEANGRLSTASQLSPAEIGEIAGISVGGAYLLGLPGMQIQGALVIGLGAYSILEAKTRSAKNDVAQAQSNLNAARAELARRLVAKAATPAGATPAAMAAAANESRVPEILNKIVIPTYVDLRSHMLLDSIAQQFYEMLGGQFAMSFMYDVLPLGKTMLDIRFDLTIHNSRVSSDGPVADLMAQYRTFLKHGKTLSQDIVDDVSVDYKDKLAKLENNEIGDTMPVFQGAVVRLFYTNANTSGSGIASAVTITGMIFDQKAVTSFIKELNGGLVVPLGPEDGNVNYKPDISFTLNAPIEPLNCRNPDIIQKVMDDYVDMVTTDKKILLNAASNPIDTTKGDLFIEKVSGASQISSTQCLIQWTETLYDPVTNTAVNGARNISRYGLFSYIIDRENWYAPNLTFDLSGFKLYPTGYIPPCQFDPTVYSASVGNRFAALGSASSAVQTITNDFVQSVFKAGAGQVCPQTIPSYTFNAADYVASNPSVSAAAAVADYKTKMLQGTNPIVKNAVIIDTSPTTTDPAIQFPITYTRPLPTAFKLTTASGLCPPTACDDLDVLYDLVDQYNSDPSMEGTILRVKRVFTPGPNQCDIEAEVNYGGTIDDILGNTVRDMTTGLPKVVYNEVVKGALEYKVVNKKTVENPQVLKMGSGVQTVNMALYVSVDKGTCGYILADASGVNSGTSIQPNTPAMFRPLDYAAELQKRLLPAAGSSLSKVQSDFSAVSGSVKDTLTKYRAKTYGALGDVNIQLKTCPAKCSDTAIMNKIMYYYNVTFGYTMNKIINVGSLDSKSCDVTFEDKDTLQTLGMNFGIDSACNITSHAPTLPSARLTYATPTYNETKDLSKPLSTANTYKGSTSGFADYSRPKAAVNFENPMTGTNEYVRAEEEAYPLNSRGFGLDRLRNSDENHREAQFLTPLEQNIPIKEIPTVTTYKYIRFRPTELRNPNADAVNVGKFTFFSKGKAVTVDGAASNPMGTWEGALKDVMGAGLRTGWSDRHKKALVLAFKAPVALDAYSITTATPGKGMGGDPISWKLEGSSTGTYWTILDEKRKFPVPVERYKEIGVQPFYEEA